MIILNTFSASFKSKFSVNWLRRLVLPIGFSGGLCKGAKYTFIFDFLRNGSMENYLAFDMDKMVDMPTCLLLSLMQLSSTSELTFYKLWWNPRGWTHKMGSWPRNEYFFQHNNFNLQNGSYGYNKFISTCISRSCQDNSNIPLTCPLSTGHYFIRFNMDGLRRIFPARILFHTFITTIYRFYEKIQTA